MRRIISRVGYRIFVFPRKEQSELDWPEAIMRAATSSSSSSYSHIQTLESRAYTYARKCAGTLAREWRRIKPRINRVAHSRNVREFVKRLSLVSLLRYTRERGARVYTMRGERESRKVEVPAVECTYYVRKLFKGLTRKNNVAPNVKEHLDIIK